MDVFHDISLVALRQIAKTVGYGVGEITFEYLVDRFTNHSQQINRALQTSSDRAWKTLESALAGPSILDWLKRADDNAVADQIRIMLESSQLGRLTQDQPGFCKECLIELRAARSEGLLTGAYRPAEELAQQVRAWTQLSDPQAALNDEWTLIERVAAELQKAEFTNLAKLLRARPGKGSPILASSVRYFFRLEVETNQRLFQGLAFAQLEDISERQKKLLGAMSAVLTQHEKRLADATDEVLRELGVIEGAIRLIQKRFDEWTKRQEKRQGQQDAWQRKVLESLEKVQLQTNREIRPADSFSIRSDGEREAVKNLIHEYRNWPNEQRRRFPELLANVGKLEVATGEFKAAERDFHVVAALATESNSKAEAYFNAYQTALEQKNWAEALAALKEAVTLDEARFAPFPFSQFEPQQILGAGGFGVVFLCKHPYLERKRVIKALRTADLDRSVGEVFSEAMALEKLRHSSIIRLLDCAFADKEKTRPFLVMDYFEGANLDLK